MIIPSESETDFKEEKGQAKCDYCNATKSVDREFEHFNGTYHLSLMIVTS